MPAFTRLGQEEEVGESSSDENETSKAQSAVGSAAKSQPACHSLSLSLETSQRSTSVESRLPIDGK